VNAAERELRQRLRERPLPGETAARRRAWEVVATAHAQRAPARRRVRPALRLAPAVAAAAVALALAVTPAGPALGDWLEERFSSEPAPARPAFARLPDDASVLALSRAGAYVVRGDGSLRRVGAFSEAEWSPRGLHVVGVSGRRLVAVTPAGVQKWTVVRPARLSHPAWSLGLGYFVAYLEGTRLRVVGGNGQDDRLLRRGAAAVTPAWRAGPGYVLTYARPGAVETLDVLTGRSLWVRRVRDAKVLEWSRRGHRLVILGERALRVLDGRGRLLRRLALPAAGRATEMVVDAAGRRAAVSMNGRGGARVVEVPLGGGSRPRVVFSGAGAVEGLAWSPDARRLLVAWRDADQWLLLGPRGRVRPLGGVSRELGRAAGFPRVAGWCCSR